MVGDRGHLVGICDYDVRITEFVPQKIGDNFGRQIGGCIAAGQGRVAQVRDHDERHVLAG